MTCSGRIRYSSKRDDLDRSRRTQPYDSRCSSGHRTLQRLLDARCEANRASRPRSEPRKRCGSATEHDGRASPLIQAAARSPPAGVPSPCRVNRNRTARSGARPGRRRRRTPTGGKPWSKSNAGRQEEADQGGARGGAPRQGGGSPPGRGCDEGLMRQAPAQRSSQLLQPPHPQRTHAHPAPHPQPYAPRPLPPAAQRRGSGRRRRRAPPLRRWRPAALHWSRRTSPRKPRASAASGAPAAQAPAWPGERAPVPRSCCACALQPEGMRPPSLAHHHPSPPQPPVPLPALPRVAPPLSAPPRQPARAPPPNGLATRSAAIRQTRATRAAWRRTCVNWTPCHSRRARPLRSRTLRCVHTRRRPVPCMY